MADLLTLLSPLAGVFQPFADRLPVLLSSTNTLDKPSSCYPQLFSPLSFSRCPPRLWRPRSRKVFRNVSTPIPTVTVAPPRLPVQPLRVPLAPNTKSSPLEARLNPRLRLEETPQPSSKSEPMRFTRSRSDDDVSPFQSGILNQVAGGGRYEVVYPGEFPFDDKA
jgi:hypothetical protein